MEESQESGGRARESERRAGGGEQNRKHAARQLLETLLSSDYLKRVQAAVELQKLGKDAAEAVVEHLQRSDVGSYVQLTAVLESLGRAAVDVIVAALRSIEVKRARDVYLAECLMDALERIDDRRASAAIAELIDRFNERIERNHNSLLVALCQHAKVKAHSILGDFGDRSRIDDLMKVIEGDPKHIRPELIETLKRIGDKRALVPLALFFENQPSTAIQEDARDAFREIIRREKVAPNDPVFQALNGQAQGLLQKLYPRVRHMGATDGAAAH